MSPAAKGRGRKTAQRKAPKRKGPQRKATQRKGTQRNTGARSPAAGGGTAAKVGLFLLRLWAGGYFLAVAHWKLIQEGYTLSEKVAAFREGEYEPMIREAISYPPEVFGLRLEFWASFLEGVMLPNAGLFAPLILFFEVVLGFCLVFGLWVRFMGVLGFLLLAAFALSKVAGGVFLFAMSHSNWPVAWILLILVFTAAGRIAGLDAFWHARGPRRLRWMG